MKHQCEIFDDPFEDACDEAAACAQIEYDQAVYRLRRPEAIVQVPMQRCEYAEGTEALPF